MKEEKIEKLAIKYAEKFMWFQPLKLRVELEEVFKTVGKLTLENENYFNKLWISVTINLIQLVIIVYLSYVLFS